MPPRIEKVYKVLRWYAPAAERRSLFWDMYHPNFVLTYEQDRATEGVGKAKPFAFATLHDVQNFFNNFYIGNLFGTSQSGPGPAEVWRADGINPEPISEVIAIYATKGSYQWFWDTSLRKEWEGNYELRKPAPGTVVCDAITLRERICSGADMYNFAEEHEYSHTVFTDDEITTMLGVMP